MMKIEQLKILKYDNFSSLEKIFSKYKTEFLNYNLHTNLISKNDEKVLFEKHIFDSLAINLFKKTNECKTLLDIGTGGGFPAVPIAIAFPEIKVVGVDSIGKKIKFINEIAATLNLKNLSGITSRTEELPLNMKDSFDIITSRAVAPLNVILEYAIPYLKVGGYFIAYKAKIVNEEIEQAQNALKTLNCKIEEIIDYKLPLDENFERNLVIIKKTKSTPKGFPRKVGIAKSMPL